MAPGDQHELVYPFSVRHPPQAGPSIPFAGDVEDWLIRLEIYSPLDHDRQRDLERWRKASDREHGDALRDLLSIADALPSMYPKPPLAVRFPKPYRVSSRIP